MKKIILLSILFLIGKYSQAQTPQWYQLDGGADSLTTAIDVHDSVIYISGDFNGAFGHIANGFGMYVNGHGVNPGAGFTGGYAKSFLNFSDTEYAGGTFNGYVLKFNSTSKTWNSFVQVNSPVIRLDTFQNQIVIATDSSVMLYNTTTQVLTTLPKNFNGFLTDITVYQNKIWMAAYNDEGDTLSNLYTWDGTTIGDSTLANFGITYLYSDGNLLFISGKEVGGGEGNGVAIYSGGRFSDTWNNYNWNFSLFVTGYATNISGNLSTGYLFGGSFQLLDGDGNFHPLALYQNGNTEVLGANLSGTAYASCFTPGGTPIAVGAFELTDSSSNYYVVTLDTSTGIAEIKNSKSFLYPNPFHNGFTVENVNENSTYQLYDELGRTVAIIRSSGTKIVFQNDQIPDGLYFLEETAHPENVIKLIKE